MFRALLNLLSPKVATPPQPRGSAPNELVEPVEAYFRNELKQSPFFKSEAHQAVMDHLLRRRSLTDTPNKLSLEQKRALGLNARMSMTQELVGVLTPSGLRAVSPKALLSDLCLRATFFRSWDDTVTRAARAGVSQFKFIADSTPDACEWCRQVAPGKVFGLEIVSAVKEACKCSPYSRGFVEPIFPDFE